MSANVSIPIELLAPARDAAIAIEALRHGADAVYMGAPMLGARADAVNSIADIEQVCRFAHTFNARVYATVNTLVYDRELPAAERMIRRLWNAGVDALIVQDMGLLRLDLPPIALHASTQCDIRTPAKALFLQQLGFSQLVLARELTLDEIAAIRRVVDVPLEAFVHGALCVCYSGRCRLSQAVKGRSGNRGQCAQLCRLPYDLLDGDRRKLAAQKHLLSLRDLDRSRLLGQMLQAGVTSFKIEGRLKDMGYVKNVVARYRQALDHQIEQSGGRYCHSSSGQCQIGFVPDVRRSFNRSFTDYFLIDRHPASGMASIDTPKSLGQPIGRVIASKGNAVTIAADVELANGDGLSFFDADGQFSGVRVNVAHGRRVTLNRAVCIPYGALLYRTHDKAMTDTLSQPSSQRLINVDGQLHVLSGRLALTLCDERGCRVTHSVDAAGIARAERPQDARQAEVLSKLGGTCYAMRQVRVLPEWFIPASVLATLRRETFDLLDRSWRMRRPRDRRRAEQVDAACFATSLSAHDNVANRLARKLYHDHGVKRIEPALECATGPESDLEVMHTRYCLRRELGACPRVKGAKKLPERLLLRSGGVLLSVQCDCRLCEMHLRLVR